MATENKRMRQLQATHTDWSAADPTLLDGEIAFSSDRMAYKVGPGLWSALPYWVDQAPGDGLNYGKTGQTWTATAVYGTHAGSLDDLPIAGEWTTYRLIPPITQAWTGGGQDGDYVMQFADDDLNRIQIGYSLSSGGAAMFWRRRVAGTWGTWVSEVASLTNPWLASLDGLAGGAGQYTVETRLGVGFTDGWPSAKAGDAIITFNDDADTATQMGISAQSSNGIWLRHKITGVWTDWDRPDVREEDIIDLDRVRWRSPYVFGTTYYGPGYDPVDDQRGPDMVRDGDWTMIANKKTTERAAPQRDFNEQWDFPADVPAWTVQQYTGVVESGRAWTNDVPITVVGYQVWVPTLTEDTNYVIRTFSYPAGQQELIEYREISEPVLLEGAWTTIATIQELAVPGYVFGIIINALNSGSDTNISGGWDRGANSNTLTNDPGTGAWGTNNAETSLRINFTDLDTTDRTTEIMGIIIGSSFQAVQTDDATKSITFTINSAPVNQGTHASFAVVVLSDTGPNGQPDVGATCTLDITVPVPSATDYVELVGGNPTVPWGTTRGLLELDGVAQPGAEANAFGVRILYDTWTVSADWDVVASVGTGGGGGGTGGPGVTEFINLIDTPATYGTPAQLVRINPGGDGLEFSDPPNVIDTFLALTDTPNDYTSQDKRIVYVDEALPDGPAGLKFDGPLIDDFVLRAGDNMTGNLHMVNDSSINVGGTDLQFATTWSGIGLGGRHALQATPAASSIALSSNAYVETNGWQAVGTNDQGQMVLSGGQTIWYAAAALDGNAITWSERFRMDGRIGVTPKFGINTGSPEDQIHALGIQAGLRLEDINSPGTFTKINAAENGSLYIRADQNNAFADSFIRFSVSQLNRMTLGSDYLYYGTTADLYNGFGVQLNASTYIGNTLVWNTSTQFFDMNVEDYNTVFFATSDTTNKPAGSSNLIGISMRRNATISTQLAVERNASNDYTGRWYSRVQTSDMAWTPWTYLINNEDAAQPEHRLEFPDRAAVVAWRADGDFVAPENGTLISAGAENIVWRWNTGESIIPDLNGMRPFGDVYPEHFGVVGAGNDAQLINRAILFVNNSLGGGTVYLQGKTYTVDATMADPDAPVVEDSNGNENAAIRIQGSNHVNLVGQPRETVITAAASTKAIHIITIGNRTTQQIAPRGSVYGVEIVGNPAPTEWHVYSSSPSYFPAGTGINVNSYGTDIGQGDQPPASIAANTGKGITIEKVVIRDCYGYGIGFERGSFEDCFITDFAIHDCKNDGIDCKNDYPDVGNSNNIVSNGYISNCGNIYPTNPADPEDGFNYDGKKKASFDIRQGWSAHNISIENVPASVDGLRCQVVDLAQRGDLTNLTVRDLDAATHLSDVYIQSASDGTTTNGESYAIQVSQAFQNLNNIVIRGNFDMGFRATGADRINVDGLHVKDVKNDAIRIRNITGESLLGEYVKMSNVFVEGQGRWGLAVEGHMSKASFSNCTLGNIEIAADASDNAFINCEVGAITDNGTNSVFTEATDGAYNAYSEFRVTRDPGSTQYLQMLMDANANQINSHGDKSLRIDQTDVNNNIRITTMGDQDIQFRRNNVDAAYIGPAGPDHEDSPTIGDNMIMVRQKGDARYLKKTGDTLTGPLLLPDGSAAAPALAFVNDTDTGLFRVTDNLMGLAVAGTKRYELAGDEFRIGWNAAGTASTLKLGYDRTGEGSAFIDFNVNAGTFPDFRLIHWNPSGASFPNDVDFVHYTSGRFRFIQNAQFTAPSFTIETGGATNNGTFTANAAGGTSGTMQRWRQGDADTRMIMFFEEDTKKYTGLVPYDDAGTNPVFGLSLIYHHAEQDWTLGETTYDVGYQILNRFRGDARYAQLAADNTFLGDQTFDSGNTYFTRSDGNNVNVRLQMGSATADLIILFQDENDNIESQIRWDENLEMLDVKTLSTPGGPEGSAIRYTRTSLQMRAGNAEKLRITSTSLTAYSTLNVANPTGGSQLRLKQATTGKNVNLIFDNPSGQVLGQLYWEQSNNVMRLFAYNFATPGANEYAAIYLDSNNGIVRIRPQATETATFELATTTIRTVLDLRNANDLRPLRLEGRSSDDLVEVKFYSEATANEGAIRYVGSSSDFWFYGNSWRFLRPGSASQYIQLAGDSSSNTLLFEFSDDAKNANIDINRATGPKLRVRYNGTVAATFEYAGTSVASGGTTVLTKDKGDALYAPIAQTTQLEQQVAELQAQLTAALSRLDAAGL